MEWILLELDLFLNKHNYFVLHIYLQGLVEQALKIHHQ